MISKIPNSIFVRTISEENPTKDFERCLKKEYRLPPPTGYVFGKTKKQHFLWVPLIEILIQDSLFEKCLVRYGREITLIFFLPL